MAVRRFRDRRPRLLAPSRILRPPVRQSGGGREREQLVEDAQATIARRNRTFALASRLLDRQARERAWLLYAWCRRCDDIADGEEFEGKLRDEEGAEQRIKAIRILTQRALDGQPTADPAFDAFGQVAQEAGFSAEEAEDVIGGCALDAEGWRPRTEADLMRYCYHVAGALGVMMARIVGVPEDEDEMLNRACDLGLSFELVTLARDACSDDAAERCYLPVEWLVEADIPPGEQVRPAYRDKLVALVARLLDLADDHAAAARHAAWALPFRQRWAVLAAANIHAAIGRKVRESGAHAWDHRAEPSLLAKLGLIALAFFEAFRKPEEPEWKPRWTRGELLIAVRMAAPIPPPAITPLPDDTGA